MMARPGELLDRWVGPEESRRFSVSAGPGGVFVQACGERATWTVEVEREAAAALLKMAIEFEVEQVLEAEMGDAPADAVKLSEYMPSARSVSVSSGEG